MRNIVIEFDDKFGGERSDEEVNFILRRINNVLKEHDFEMSYSGNPDEFFKELRERFEKIKS